MMDAIDIQRAVRNVLHILQEEPERYRNFGVFWWFMKALLKRYYTTDNLYFLGDYEDLNAPELPAWDLQRMLREAFDEYRRNAQYGLGSNKVGDLDGQPYTIYDQDAGL